uniref:Peroxisomal membrane protein PEX14-like KPWE domain-containing protein n=1 Tax=Mastacembelus armatus TaxID=205130 RepID=A0A7N8WRP4_9TELE
AGSGRRGRCSRSPTAEMEATKLSFAEVMRLVQEGREVPGAIKLDIKPSNQSPTPSQMERIPKPWEEASTPNFHEPGLLVTLLILGRSSW